MQRSAMGKPALSGVGHAGHRKPEKLAFARYEQMPNVGEYPHTRQKSKIFATLSHRERALENGSHPKGTSSGYALRAPRPSASQ